MTEWLCPTDLCFTNLAYSGLGNFSLGSLKSRDAVVKALKDLGPIVVGYVANNPGPSTIPDA